MDVAEKIEFDGEVGVVNESLSVESNDGKEKEEKENDGNEGNGDEGEGEEGKIETCGNWEDTPIKIVGIEGALKETGANIEIEPIFTILQLDEEQKPESS